LNSFNFCESLFNCVYMSCCPIFFVLLCHFMQFENNDKKMTVDAKRKKFKLAAKRFKEKRQRDIRKYRQKINSRREKNHNLKEQLEMIVNETNYLRHIYTHNLKQNEKLIENVQKINKSLEERIQKIMSIK
ncbi:hypothetical protein MHBO_001396, partial [Bonamia ostreae]